MSDHGLPIPDGYYTCSMPGYVEEVRLGGRRVRLVDLHVELLIGRVIGAWRLLQYMPARERANLRVAWRMHPDVENELIKAGVNLQLGDAAPIGIVRGHLLGDELIIDPGLPVADGNGYVVRLEVLI